MEVVLGTRHLSGQLEEVQGGLEVALGHSLDRCKEARGLG